jgi:hypothetical protein
MLLLTNFYIGFDGHPLRKDFPLTVCSYLLQMLIMFNTLSGLHRGSIRRREETRRLRASANDASIPVSQASSIIIRTLQFIDYQCSNFESLSPWEQVGQGTEPMRPAELKPIPPPQPEQPPKK